MLDDDFDDEMMISDMPTMNNKTNSKNKHDATTVTSNSGGIVLYVNWIYLQKISRYKLV
jgi:hypothetical protein